MNGLTDWKYRRRFMWIISVFCMANIAYVLIAKLETAPADTSVTMSFLTLMGIVGSYVFGAVWDDKNQMRFTAPKPGTTARRRQDDPEF